MSILISGSSLPVYKGFLTYLEVKIVGLLKTSDLL